MIIDRARINAERERRGIAPLPEGPGRPRGPRPDERELRRLYVNKGLSLRATADVLGLSKDVVWAALQEAGIKRRPHTRESRLASWRLRDLRARVERKGLRPTARALGVNWATLRDYLKRRKCVR